MNDPTPVQTAIVAALRTAPATYPVYDSVPQGAAKPYNVVGEFTGDPDEELATATTDGAFNIHSWSSASDKGQVYAMQQFNRARLDGQAISGTWACTEDFNEVFEDPASTAASRLYHGVARYRVRVG